MKEQHECEQCGELNTITRDIKGQIVPEDCAFCSNTNSETLSECNCAYHDSDGNCTELPF